MAKMHEFRLRLRALFSKRRMDREMAEELDFHQDMLREKLLRQGVPEASVDGAARRVFGNPMRWHERLRELWQFKTLENLSRDVSFSIRLLRRSPGFTSVALLTLVLGVGANTAIFSLINGLLLRPLPAPHAEELAVIGIQQAGPRTFNYSLPAPFFRSLERRHEVFADVFAFEPHTFQVRANSNNENISGQFVSGQFFRALQTPALLGRALTPDDDVTGGSPAGLAVVISEHFWRSWFGGAPDVVGRKLQIDNTMLTVAGVMPKSFVGASPTQQAEIFAPLAAEPILEGARSMVAAGYHGWWLTVMGRMQPGVTVEQANAALLPVSMPIVNENVSEPGWIARAEKNHFHFTAEPGSKGFTYIRFIFRKPLIAVFAMCGGVLLLGCLNLAGLLMARGAARERELATRLAMGATRRRLVQQLLMESLLIALMGTMIGLAVAPFVSRALAAMLMSGAFASNVHLDTSLDFRVFGFASIAAVVAALLIGLVPALQATSRNLHDHIKDGQHATQAHERQRILPRLMLAAEVGLAMMLVVGAGLLSTSLVRLYRTDLGFDAKGLVNIAVKTDKQSLDGDELLMLYEQFGDALSHQPGVKSVSFARMVPLSNFEWDEDYSVPGGGVHNAKVNGVGPAYFQTMHIPLLEGREYRWTDKTATGMKIILNQAAAKLFFPGRSPIGQSLLLQPKKTPYEVVAVVGDAKYDDLRTPSPPTVYPAITQGEEGERGKPSYTAVVRVDGPAAPVAGAARSIAARLAPDIPAPVTATMESVLDSSISSERVMALLSVFFAVCALLVTGIGLYGTLAYATARRTSEIGIRMALGARRAQVVRMVFRENSLIAVVGSGAGLVAAVLASRALASFLYSTSSRDPWVMVASVAAVVLIASAASLVPALRAARIEPMAAIRHE